MIIGYAGDINKKTAVIFQQMKYLIVIIIGLLPFILFHWMLPFVTHIYPGQDFVTVFSFFQTEYVYAMKTGTFPLNTVWHNFQNNQWAGMAGAYHPLAYIAGLLPGYANGYAVAWNVFLQFILLAITHLTLFKFLKKIRITSSIAFFLSMITVYSPRIITSFSFGGATVAWSGFLLLFTAIGFYCLRPAGKKLPLTIIGLTYWLVSSSFPEEIYFALLGVAIFLLIIPFFLSVILPEKDIDMPAVLGFWGRTIVWCFLGTALSSAFFVPFIIENFHEIALSHQNYESASTMAVTIADLINGFFLPINANSTGCIGSSPLLVAVLFLPLLSVLRAPPPKILWLIWALLILSLLCMLGEATPLHYCFWRYIPLYSASRYASRISMLVPMLFLLLLIWLFKKNTLSSSLLKKKKLSPLTTLALLSLLLMVLYIVIPKALESPSLLLKLNHYIIPYWTGPLLFISGISVLLTAVYYGTTGNIKKQSTAGIILCVVACLHLTIFFRYASIPRKKIPAADIRTFEQFLTHKQKTMNAWQGHYLFGLDKMTYPKESVLQLQRYFEEPFLGKIYRRYIHADDRDEAYAILNQKRKKNEIVVEAPTKVFQNIHQGVSPACRGMADKVSLGYSSFNRLVFDVQACQPSIFMFSYNRNGHWQARVNGSSVPTYRANGYAHAIRIPTGTSTVEFRYWSWAAFYGMLLSCLTLGGIGIFCGLFILQKPGGIAVGLAVMAGAGFLFFLWFHSLYNGQNLQTHYNWRTPKDNRPPNIAYGKSTRMSSPSFSSIQLNLIHNSDYGVDGGRTFASCFSTSTQPSPWFEIDLGQSRKIASIHIYATLQGKEPDNIVWYTTDSVAVSDKYDFLVLKKTPVTFNLTPLKIEFSTDRKNWQWALVSSIAIAKNKPKIVRLEKPVKARFVRIKASGECRLCLNEVEVYPPVVQKD